MLIAQVTIFFERFVDDVFQFVGNFVVESNRRDRDFVQDGIKNRRGGVAFEGQNSGGHFIENRAGGK